MTVVGTHMRLKVSALLVIRLPTKLMPMYMLIPDSAHGRQKLPVSVLGHGLRGHLV